jgi:hypothetical protein
MQATERPGLSVGEWYHLLVEWDIIYITNNVEIGRCLYILDDNSFLDSEIFIAIFSWNCTYVHSLHVIFSWTSISTLNVKFFMSFLCVWWVPCLSLYWEHENILLHYLTKMLKSFQVDKKYIYVIYIYEISMGYQNIKCLQRQRCSWPLASIQLTKYHLYYAGVL